MNNNLKLQVSEIIKTAKEYWINPRPGNYVPYKEVATLGGSGFGIHWASLLAAEIGLSAGSFLVGASIGLDGLHLSIMLIIANLVGIPIAFFRGWFFDNHKYPGGKFVPILLRTPVPICALSALFVWLPYENWSYMTKIIVVWCMYMVIQFFLSFYMEGWAFLQQVITPNAQERAHVMSISQIIYSLAPTISSAVVPTVAGLTFGADNIWSYRIIYPGFTLVGVVVIFIFMPKVKERIVMPKQKLEYISVIDSVREVARNKYFWIINSAGWIGFLESAYSVILGWSFVYAFEGAYEPYRGLANTIIGNAALWAMLIVPYIIKIMGKRNLLIIHNIINVFLLLILLPTYKNILWVVVIFYLNTFINTFQNIYLPGIQADMRDYHQWKTGVRIDGLFAPLGTIGTVISFGTGLVIPFINRTMGLRKDYTVLYNDELRNNLVHVLIICSVIGAILNLIPYLFYDLTEEKHRGYINVLKIRSTLEDYRNGELEDAQLIETVELIHKARETKDFTKRPIDKTALKRAKALPKKDEAQAVYRNEMLKKARQEILQTRLENELIGSLPIVIDELEKFTKERYRLQLERARIITDGGQDSFYKGWRELRASAQELSKSSKQDKEIRRDTLNLARKLRRSEKLLMKNAGSIEKPDEYIKQEIQEREVNTLSERYKAYNDLKKYTKRLSLFRRFMEPYDEAERFIVQAENYKYLDEIEDMYIKATTKA